MVEDLEYHIHLLEAGYRVELLEDATVFGEMPVSGAGARTQRARWEGGRLLMMRTLPPRLLRSVFAGRLRLIEPLLDVCGLPLAFAATSLLLLLLLPFPVGFRWLHGYAAAGILVSGFHLLIALRAGEKGWRDLVILLAVPRYIAWKLWMLPRIFLASRRNASWERTQRDKSVDFSSSTQADALE